ncbi:MAG TPA: ABC transporter permease [Thermoanaerobaculia bacterium]|nr:ABC transporter permease [Thermoanaerobaculia bacterium]HQR68115.1 ABC transporter permease [Thermoanaerobaculia bacterium]
MTFLGLVENETLKILRRKRFRVVLLVLVVLLSVVVFGQARQRRIRERDHASESWRARVEARVSQLERRLSQQRNMPESWGRWSRFEVGRLKYHLEKGIDPDAATGPVFSRGFAAIGSVLLLPLLVAVLVADLVSTEVSEGTITLLLTRPVARWKVLLSKYVVMVLFTTLTLLLAALLSWAVAGLAFGWAGWGAPVVTGFRLSESGFDVTKVRVLALWQDAFAAWGLAWYSALAVGAVTMLLSVVFRSTAAALGTMMATLIGGTILSRVASEWEGAKWFFVSCLPLPEYAAGMPTPYPGMSLAFCAWVLLAWAAGATALAFFLFGRRDVTS